MSHWMTALFFVGPREPIVFPVLTALHSADSKRDETRQPQRRDVADVDASKSTFLAGRYGNLVQLGTIGGFTSR